VELCLHAQYHFNILLLKSAQGKLTPAAHPTQLYAKVKVKSHVITDDQSASLSWNKAPIWGLRPDFHYCQTIAGLLMFHYSSLYSPDANRTENVSSIIASYLVSGETTCPQSCSLAMAVIQ
jgi:hypothetical protein